MKKLSDDLYGFTDNMHERALALEHRIEELEAERQDYIDRELVLHKVRAATEDERDALRTRVAELEKALAEAMDWNWLDDDAEETIPAWIAETLKPKP